MFLSQSLLREPGVPLAFLYSKICRSACGVGMIPIFKKEKVSVVSCRATSALPQPLSLPATVSTYQCALNGFEIGKKGVNAPTEYLKKKKKTKHWM